MELFLKPFVIFLQYARSLFLRYVNTYNIVHKLKLRSFSAWPTSSITSKVIRCKTSSAKMQTRLHSIELMQTLSWQVLVDDRRSIAILLNFVWYAANTSIQFNYSSWSPLEHELSTLAGRASVKIRRCGAATDGERGTRGIPLIYHFSLLCRCLPKRFRRRILPLWCYLESHSDSRFYFGRLM